MTSIQLTRTVRPAQTVSLRLSQKTQAVLAILGSAFFFALMNALARQAGDLPVAQKCFFRNVVSVPLAALVIPLGDDMDWAVRCAAALRDAGVRTQVYAEKKKVKAKFAYADKLAIPFAAVVGEDEKAAGTVGLKDLRSGRQVTVTPQQAAEIILKSIDRHIRPVKGS